jgi:hypothetical protein
MTCQTKGLEIRSVRRGRRGALVNLGIVVLATPAPEEVSPGLPVVTSAPASMTGRAPTL